MSQDANATPAGGLKSTLKVAVPIVALMAVIFGITLFSVYTPPKPSDVGKEKPGTSGVTNNEPPLRFFSSTRAWDPPSLAPEYQHFPLLAPSRDPSKELPFQFSVQDRVFQGFYETGPQVRCAAFWFENRNSRSVTLQLQGVNCGACSGGRVAAIPPAVMKAYMHRTALASLPIGAFNAFGVGLADPAADFERLEWTRHKFSENPHATYKVPAAADPPDKWAPQWGILELTFTVSDNPKVPLVSGFATEVDGSPDQRGEHSFQIFYAPSQPFVVSTPTIDVGEINQLTKDAEYTFLVYSATRKPDPKWEFGDLPEPTCVVQAPTGIEVGKFVEVAKKVERLPESALLDVERDLDRQKKFTKVLTAYRVTVTVRRKVGDTQLDIGQMERTIYITAGDAKPQAVLVTAMVKGPVGLANGKTSIEIPPFKGREGFGEKHADGAFAGRSIGELVTDAPGMELAVVEGECRPKFIKYEVVKKADRGGRGVYDLKVTVPPGRQFGAILDNPIIVIESKGLNPQRIRIPVKGSGDPG